MPADRRQRERGDGADSTVANCPRHREQTASICETHRAVPLLIVNESATQVERIVFHHLLEFSRRHFVDGEVFRILAVPIEFDLTRHITMNRGTSTASI